MENPFRDIPARSIVAVLLACSFVLFILLSGANHLIGHAPLPAAIAATWSDVMNVLLGGLLAYASQGSDKPS